MRALLLLLEVLTLWLAMYGGVRVSAKLQKTPTSPPAEQVYPANLREVEPQCSDDDVLTHPSPPL